MSVLQAFLISIVYFLANGTLIGVGFFTVYRPLVAGFVTGLILGDPVTGTVVGASINVMYVGHISAGGSLPGDPALAGIVGSALAITAGVDVNASLAIATSVGLLGTLLWFGRLTLNTVFAHMADKFAAAGKAKNWWIVNVGIPQALLFLITAGPCFIIVYYGAANIQSVLAFLGQRVLGILIILGGMLPALGLALTLKYIFQKDARVYFFLGFVITKLFNLNMISIGLLGLIIAIVYMQNRSYVDGVAGNEQISGEDIEEDDFELSLDRKTLVRSYVNFAFHAQGAYNYERMQGIGFAHSMVPAFQKWYKEGSPEMAAALQRHTGFYNTNPQFGTIINGLVLAMEERNYVQGMQFDDETINSIKTSLMGPIAGIGDTLVQGVILPLLLSFFIGMGMEGNIAAPIIFSIAISVVIMGGGWMMFTYGYRKGNAAIVRILESGYINKIIDAAKVMGCLVVGALVANYVSVKTGIELTFSETNVFNLQTAFFDAIFPGILPLGITMLAYWLLQKGQSSTRVMLILVAVAIVGGLTGILA